MAKSLPTRPNLDHLRSQAKTLLADLKGGDVAAARVFIKHLPAAAKLAPAKVKAAGLRLADAQSAVAREAGFKSWPDLARHVEHLRGLEGEWQFLSLQIDGNVMPAGAFGASRLLIDGDRFRTESPEANYDGVFSIDTAHDPMRIDIEFVEGPEAGNWSYGIFELNRDQLTLCLGLTGASRPNAFSTKPGTGHALERLRRASAERPERVTGGARGKKPAAPPVDSETPVDTSSFDVPMTPLMKRLQGEWAAVKLVRDGEDMRADWLPFGSRTTIGNETKVTFGGQVMAHAKMRIDEGTKPIAVDYLNLSGGGKGKISLGILDFVGDEARFQIASPGLERPSSFTATGKGLTLSQWKLKSDK